MSLMRSYTTLAPLPNAKTSLQTKTNIKQILIENVQLSTVSIAARTQCGGEHYPTLPADDSVRPDQRGIPEVQRRIGRLSRTLSYRYVSYLFRKCLYVCM